MIAAKHLLEDLKRLLRRLEGDLRERADTISELNVALQGEYRAARDAGRTGEAFEVWREGMLTQAAAAWLLGCVFVRFLEDNGLVEEALISGPGERRNHAAERQILYFQEHPLDSDRDYLYAVFRVVAKLPAVATLFDERHNPLWTYGISGDAAKELIAFWRQVVPETGRLVHDFTDETWNTRFLGDLYQDLSEDARKRYALLQTPEFVEEFILDRTLEPALAEFGLRDVRLIDPTCGSGHFLLGAFRRILERWFRTEPGTVERELVQRALNAIYGVDLNPYAVAIARFRLLLEALRASGIGKLKEAPAFRINVAVGDSLLHGARFGELDLDDARRHRQQGEGIRHTYQMEDLGELNRILGQQYHAVVGNPPYITVKDRALNQAYRNRFATCHRQYSLVVPFVERFFELAMYGHGAQPAGYVGMITANSFMKREFGKKLIEEFFPRVDLTHVINTLEANIPGHGTPTVILFGRDRLPVGQTVRAVFGIRGEPGTPTDPAKGLVWRSIVDLLDHSGAQNDFVSVTDVPRQTFAKHPWSVGGGGAIELKEQIENASHKRLGDCIAEIGRTTHSGEDEVFYLPTSSAGTLVLAHYAVPLIIGERVRDWQLDYELVTLFPYDQRTGEVLEINDRCWTRHFWVFRTCLKNRMDFGNYIEDRGLRWFEHSMFFPSRFRTPLSIAFAFVATHNHFVLDRGGKVFKQSAPIIKLPADATEDDHLALLGLLNSSTACFWMQQVFHNKGGPGGASSKDEKWHDFYEHDGTKLRRFPIPHETSLSLVQSLDGLAQEYASISPNAVIQQGLSTRKALDKTRERSAIIRSRMIALQEELDWQCYSLYGLYHDVLCAPIQEVPPIRLGERAFEIVMAQAIASGELATKWFAWHGSIPITTIPTHWPEPYRLIVQKRIQAIQKETHIALLEGPRYKRRWEAVPWEEQERRALRNWLLDRLEDSLYWQEPSLQTTRTLANKAQMDGDFLQVAELYRGHAGFDVHALVAELVASESVPFLPVLRYKASGLRKRDIWERTWAQQRREDAIDADVAASLHPRVDESAAEFQERLKAEQRRRKQKEIGDIPPPPKYTSVDFQGGVYWRLRGPLDVPKERFISYPFCAPDSDPTLVIAWAGWDYLQQARALAAWYTELIEREGWPPERLQPPLAGLAELIPWIKQWHNDIDPEFNQRMGDFFELFLHGQLQQYGLTHEDLRLWTPPAASRARRRRLPG